MMFSVDGTGVHHARPGLDLQRAVDLEIAVGNNLFALDQSGNDQIIINEQKGIVWC